MPETPYSQPRKPNIIKKHKDDAFQNPNSNWFKMTAGFGLCSGYLLSQINNYPDYKMFLITGSIAIGLVWFKVCGLSPMQADKSVIKFFFAIDAMRGRNLMNKLTVKETTLRKVFPLKKIHSGGLIEFTGREFGVLIQLNPKRITDEERTGHTLFVKGIVDGLHDGRIFKIIACSKTNPRKIIVEHLMKVANKTGSKERAEHLNGLLQKVMADKTPIMAYRYYAFLGLGKHDSLQSAEIAKGATIEGLLLNMKRANMQPQVMDNIRSVRNAYREMTSERVIL
jgi:hypothetical protein